MDTPTDALAKELRRLVEARALETHFQPILDASGERIHGHEALTRGPAGSALRQPLELLACAQAAGQSVAVDLLMMELAIVRFAASGAPGQLFINLLPPTLIHCDDLAQRIAAALAVTSLRPRNLVIEVTEHGLSDDAAAIQRRVQPLRQLGCEIAIDDLGAGSSGLKIWSELRPDYVKIDRYFTAQIESDVVVAEILRSMLDMAHVMGSRVVAEGVENLQQCALLQDIGVDYLQGYYLRKPQPAPLHDITGTRPILSAETLQAASCAEDLLIERPALPADIRIEEVVGMFRKHVDWHSLAVVADGRPCGIVRRDALLTLLSKPLYPEIFNRKPVSKAMDGRPLIVDARARLEQVSRLVTGAEQSASTRISSSRGTANMRVSGARWICCAR